MKKLFALTLGLVAAAMFVSCSEKDSGKDSKNPAVQCSYEITLSVPDAAVDQQDVIKTVLTTPDNQGNKVPEEFTDAMETLSHELSGIKPLPYSATITISQELKKTGEQLTKDKYFVGLDYSLRVESATADGGVVDAQIISKEDVGGSISKDKIAAAYPKEINIKISVDANGVVTVQD